MTDTPSAMDVAAMIDEIDRDYNRKTNRLIERHAEQIKALIAERDALRAAISEIKAAWDWWQADSYDRCSSVVSDAIDDAVAAPTTADS